MKTIGFFLGVLLGMFGLIGVLEYFQPDPVVLGVLVIFFVLVAIVTFKAWPPSR